jgi:hypothetical protein
MGVQKIQITALLSVQGDKKSLLRLKIEGVYDAVFLSEIFD